MSRNIGWLGTGLGTEGAGRASRRWARCWVRRQGRWRAQAWAHRLAGVERVGGRQAQAASGRAGRWALARAGRAGAGWRQVQACRQACGSRRADTAGTRAARAAAGAGARGACGAGLAGRKARGLGARAGLGQCTRCTRPIFDPF